MSNSSEYNKEYYRKNREKLRLYKQAWYKEHRSEQLARVKANVQKKKAEAKRGTRKTTRPGAKAVSRKMRVVLSTARRNTRNRTSLDRKKRGTTGKHDSFVRSTSRARPSDFAPESGSTVAVEATQGAPSAEHDRSQEPFLTGSTYVPQKD